MRNSGGSTDNIGFAGKKTSRAGSHFDVQRPRPASAAGSYSSLRGADVVDAEFVHVDDNDSSPRAAAPAKAFVRQSPRPEQIAFENDRSAGFRRLGLFSGSSPSSDRGRAGPLFGLATVAVALGLGGIWMTGGDKAGSVTTPPISSGSIAPATMPGSVVPADPMISQGASADPLPTGSTPTPPADQTAGQRKQGSMIYIKSAKRRLGDPGAAPVRNHKDLTVSLAGGSGGR